MEKKLNNKTQETRRSFIQKGTVAALGAIAFPTIVKSSTLGLNGTVSANNRLGFGYIGAGGGIMQGHNNTFSTQKEVQSLYLCDVDKKKLKRVYDSFNRRGFKDVKAVEDYEDVINDPAVDAVVVGTPDHWHVAIAIAAMSKGKDVYVEKPLSLTIEEGKAITAAEKKYGSIVQVGSQQRSDKNFRRAAELVRNGYIGEVKEVYAKLGQFPSPVLENEEPIPAHLNYDKWLGQASYEPYFTNRVKGAYHGGWRCFWDYGCRKNGDWGAHHFDIIQWALGMDNSGPKRFVPKGYKGEKYAHFFYENGIKVIRDHPDYNEMITFIGTEGQITVGRSNRFSTTVPSLNTAKIKPTEIHLYDSINHRRNWLDGIYSRKETICPARVGHRSATICQLSAIAERLERPINWDPKAEQIVGDDEAKRWMSRPRRAGYELPV